MTHPGTRDFDPDHVNTLVRAEYTKYDELVGRALTAGEQYSTGRLFEDVSDTDSANLLLQNPDDSSVYLIVFSRFTTTGKFYAHKSMNVSVSDYGTTIDAVQRRSDIDNGNEAEVSYDATVDESDADVFTSKVVGSGSGGGAAISGSTAPMPEVVVAPGDNVYFYASNETDSSRDITIDVDFTEVEEEILEGIGV